MKKIGILTFHKVPNYGAALQSFALMHYLQNEYGPDYKVAIVDYTCNGNGAEFEPKETFRALSKNRNVFVRMAKRVISEFRFGLAYRKKYAAFMEFTEKHLCIDAFSAKQPLQYDYLFLGSDQIWNPRITHGYQAAYFGQDRRIKNTIAIGYAASCGDIAEFTQSEREELIDLIRKIPFVGVREQSLYNALTECGIKCYPTVDPSLLLSAKDYNRLLGIKEKDEAEYVLEYALQNDPKLDALAELIAVEKGVHVKKICGYLDCMDRRNNQILDAGPIELLESLANCRHVVTNSFHGVTFSLIYKKDFSVILPRSRQSRILDILEDLKIKDRIQGEERFSMGAIDYEKVDSELKRRIDGSKNYIRKTLNEVCSDGKV